MLTDAAIRGAKDDLLGLKENIIIGHLIPAGTGIYRYAEIDIEPPAGFEPPPPPPRWKRWRRRSKSWSACSTTSSDHGSYSRGPLQRPEPVPDAVPLREEIASAESPPGPGRHLERANRDGAHHAGPSRSRGAGGGARARLFRRRRRRAATSRRRRRSAVALRQRAERHGGGAGAADADRGSA